MSHRCQLPSTTAFPVGALFRLLSAAALAVSMALIVPLSAAARPFRDAGGRVVEIPDSVERVLPAGPPAAVLAYVLAPSKLVGWVRPPSAAEKALLSPEARDLPAVGRITSLDGALDLAALRAAKPDLILDVGTVDARYIALADRVQQETGIPYVLIDGALDRTPETLRAAGTLLGVSDRAAQLAEEAQAMLSVIRARLATLPTGPRPTIYYGRGPEGLETGLSGSINMEFLGAVGARNPAAALGTGGLTRVRIEDIAVWNPQMILAADPRFAAAAKADPRLAGTGARRLGQVYAVPSLPFGFVDTPPGVNRLIGLRWLFALLYPDMAGAAFRRDVQRFYALFYRVDLGPAELDQLLAGALPPG